MNCYQLQLFTVFLQEMIKSEQFLWSLICTYCITSVVTLEIIGVITGKRWKSLKKIGKLALKTLKKIIHFLYHFASYFDNCELQFTIIHIFVQKSNFWFLLHFDVALLQLSANDKTYFGIVSFTLYVLERPQQTATPENKKILSIFLFFEGNVPNGFKPEFILMI